MIVMSDYFARQMLVIASDESNSICHVTGSASRWGSPKLCVVVELLLLASAKMHEHRRPSHKE